MPEGVPIEHEDLDHMPEISVGLLEYILDEELYFAADTALDDYDEYRHIAHEAREAAEAMRYNTWKVADSLGIVVTAEDLATWRPSHAEQAKLRQDLARQRRMLTMMRSTTEYVAALAEGARSTGVPLRNHQRVVVESFNDFLVYGRRNETGGKSGLIQMPTGTGKTGIFANITAALKHGENEDEPIRVLVLVPTQTILEQTMGRGGHRGFGKFAPHLDIGAYYQDEKELNHEVVVMCNASFNDLMEQSALPHFDAVIVDEAHTVIGKTSADNIRSYCADRLAVGLTATPEYDEVRTAYKLFDHTICEMELPDAVKGGLLAPVRAWLKKVEATIDFRSLPAETNAQKAAIRKANLEARKSAAIEIIKQEIERGVGVIVRCPPGDDIDYARSFAKELRTILVRDEWGLGNRWIDAAFVGGKDQKRTHRTELLEFYDEGRIDVLTYVKAIGMGWDSPHAKVFINLAPTSSRTEMVQAIGRVLRLSRDRQGNPVEARVYDFVDSELGKYQYTPLMALKTESGQLLGHEEPEEIVVSPRRRQRHRARAEVLDFQVKTVGTVALANELQVVFPGEAEVEASADLISPDAKISRAEACRILGVSPPTFKQMLSKLGFSPNASAVTYGDIPIMIDLFPGLQVQPLPKTGYVDLVKLGQQAPREIRPFVILRLTRSLGFHPHRFRNDEGEIRYYIEEGLVGQLLEEAERRDYRPFIGQ